MAGGEASPHNGHTPESRKLGHRSWKRAGAKIPGAARRSPGRSPSRRPLLDLSRAGSTWAAERNLSHFLSCRLGAAGFDGTGQFVMSAPGNSLLASETPSGAGLKVLHLVRPIKQEKMSTPVVTTDAMPESEHVCTICGERSAHKAAFNAHIRAHLKEKLSTKLERRSEQQQVRQVSVGSSPRASPAPPPPTVKRKLETSATPCSPIPLNRRIKLELPEVVNHSLLPTLVELQVLEPSLATPTVFPSPPPSEPDSSMQLSNEFSQEMEMNRVDLNNDLSLILDQIEKDFEAPSLELQDVSLDTPPESDSEQDYLSLLTPTTPEKVVVQRIELPEPCLNHMVEDHDYLMRSIKQEAPPSPDPSPASSPHSYIIHKKFQIMTSQPNFLKEVEKEIGLALDGFI